MSKKTVKTTASGLAQFTGMKNLSPLDTEEVTELGQYFNKSSGGGTDNYDDLVNRPQINSHTLTGNMSGSDLGLQDTISDIDTIRAGAAAGATAVQPAVLSDYQPKIDSTHMLSADLVDDTSTTHKFATQTQLDQIGINENNILLIEQMNGAKNKFNFEAWKNCGVFNGTKTVNGNSFTLVASGEDCFTYYENSGPRQYPINARIPCNAGDKVVLTWEYTPLSSQSDDRIGIFANGSTSTGFFVLTSASDKKLEFTTPTGTTYISIRFGVRTSGNSATYGNIQIQSKASYDAGFTDYQPYAMSNAEITAWILAHS